MNSTWDRFVPAWEAFDQFRDEPERLTFLVGRAAKGSRKWVLYRCSIECFETGSFPSAEDAKAWGDRLTARRPVRWKEVR